MIARLPAANHSSAIRASRPPRPGRLPQRASATPASSMGQSSTMTATCTRCAASARLSRNSA